MKVRVGVIGSSGGSALIAATACLAAAGHELEPILVSDRECGMTVWAKNQGCPVRQVSYDSPEGFSAAALRYFQEHGCEDVMLFYTRRVAPPLIDTLKVWNIHPALLPAFVGLHAVNQALKSRVRLFGATLHRVDSGLDTGPIVAQVAAPLPPGIMEKRALRLSYIQKVWLILVWFELVAGREDVSSAVQLVGPGLALSSSDLLDERLKGAFLDWLCILEKGNGEGM